MKKLLPLKKPENQENQKPNQDLDGANQLDPVVIDSPIILKDIQSLINRKLKIVQLLLSLLNLNHQVALNVLKNLLEGLILISRQVSSNGGSDMDTSHFPFPEEKTTKPFKPIRLTKTTKQVKHSRPFGSNKKDKTIVVIQEDEPVDFNEDDETIEVKNDDEGMSLNSASLIISDIDSYLQELSAGSGCKEWKKTNHSGNNSSTPGLNIAPLVAESSNHFEDSCSIKQTNSNGYHQFKESGIPTDYCVEEDNNFMRDFQEAPTFGKMEHYIGSQISSGIL
ncbi:unnamed protein product [[Candida] boidinii]|nr:unnamed protein product [[Candida] boidinii]